MRHRAMIALFLVLFASTAALAFDPGGLEIGEVVPDSACVPLDGGAPITLTANANKRVQLMIAFQDTCVFCQKEVKQLNLLLPRIDKTKVDLVAVGVDCTVAELKAFKDKFGVTYPMLADPKGDLLRLYNIQYVPRFYLIDAERKLRNQGGQDSATGFINKINAVIPGGAQGI